MIQIIKIMFTKLISEIIWRSILSKKAFYILFLGFQIVFYDNLKFR